jgi:hypothetical protein
MLFLVLRTSILDNSLYFFSLLLLIFTNSL